MTFEGLWSGAMYCFSLEKEMKFPLVTGVFSVPGEESHP